MTNTKHYNYENFLIPYPSPLPPYKNIYCLFNLSHMLYLIKLTNQKFKFIVALNAYQCLRYHITTEQFSTTNIEFWFKIDLISVLAASKC